MATSGFSGGGDHRGSAGAWIGAAGDRTAVCLRGEFDFTTARLVSSVLVEAVDLRDADVVVDLTDVDFMDGSTVRALVHTRDALAARGRLLTVRFPPRHARRLLEVCGLEDLIEEQIVDLTEEETGAVVVARGTDR